MNNSNTSNAARVPASLKFAALAASILVPASAFAQAEDSYGVTSPDQSVSAKLFGGFAQDRPIKNAKIPRVDIVGVTVEYTKNLTPYIDFVAAASIGGGDSEYDRTEYGTGSYSKYSAEVTLATYEVEVGVNFTAPICDSFSLFIGPRVGVNALYAEVDQKEKTSSSSAHKERDDTDFGFLYGVDAGAVFSFTDQHALTLGVGCRASTANPDVSGLEIETQSWVRVSLGYRFSF